MPKYSDIKLTILKKFVTTFLIIINWLVFKSIDMKLPVD